MDIIDLLIDKMEEVENDYHRRDLKGSVKKAEVLYLLEQFIIAKWGDEIWEKYRPLLPVLIDFIIKVSRNEVVLRLNEEVEKAFRRCSRCC